MKKIFILSFILIGLALQAQKDVYLKINHLLGSAPFALNTPASNDLGDNFEVTRMYYYISLIKLTYDGGQDTVLADTYIMVDARQPVNQLLGTFNITNLESIEFGIGVDIANNHADITLFPTGHPLHFQTPSMHWGWAAGYRFIAFEGLTGAAMNQVWEIHALGDKNYGFASIPTSGDLNGNDLIIALDADYTKAVKGIKVTANLIYHGEDGVAPTILSNFQSEVFTKGGPDVSINELKERLFSIAPNPSHGLTRLIIEDGNLQSGKVVVMDITGKIVLQKPVSGEREVALEIDKPGLYMVSLEQNGQIQGTQKLVVE